LQFTYPKAYIKDAQATGEAFSSKREPPALQKMKILSFFLLFGSFLPSWIRICNLYADPNPDPAAQINADPDTDLDPKPWLFELYPMSKFNFFDQNPHGLALWIRIRIGSALWIRIRIEIKS
jgi:hypothetical protein